jgi:hypothetical protein
MKTPPHVPLRRQTKILRRAFVGTNAGRKKRIVPRFASVRRHIICDDHAHGGERRTINSIEARCARLQRLVPDLRFDMYAVAVNRRIGLSDC